MLNSAASALVNIDPAGTTRDETIGRNLASEYSNIHGKSESVREQLQSLNMVNREDMNDRVKMGSQSKTKEDGSAKRSQPVGNVTQRKETSPGTEKNKRILPMTPGTASTAASGTAMTPKSLYSTPSQPAPSTVSSSEKTISKRSSTSSLSSASNTSSVSSEGPEDELRLTDTKQTHIVVYKFVARHDDEINLEIGDAVHVDKKCEDLWFEGINLRTGKAGIFPSRYVSDILQQTSIQDNSNGAQVNQFSVRFLGSVEVNGFKGNEIICDAMRQIVKQHQLTSTARPPACILDVTERGIRITEHPVAGQRRDSASSKKSRKGKLGKIFEKESKEPPKSHYFALKNVTFCGCHPHNARFFAFITKHPEDHRFACHVFMSEFSTEPVASAIGRAFKKFYADFLDYQAPVEDFYIE